MNQGVSNPPGNGESPWWVGYPVAVLLVLVLTALLFIAHPYLPLGNYPIFYVIVVMAVAYRFGAGPGIVAVVLGLVAFDYFFIAPVGALWPPGNGPAAWAAYTSFLIGTALVAVVMILIRRSQRRAQRLMTDVAEQHRRQQLAAQVLSELNKQHLSSEILDRVVAFIREFLDVEAVGIRLQEAGDYPYRATRGYSESWLQAENLICTASGAGTESVQEYGRGIPECLCGLVLLQRTDSTQPFFTPWGSFWTNHLSELAAGGLEETVGQRLRTRCLTEGYESLALIPLRSGDEIVGLLHVSDKRPGRFDLGLIEALERNCASIGIAFARMRAEEALSQSEERLRLAQAAANVGTWDWNPKSGEVTFTPEWLSLYGLPASSPAATYEEWARHVHPEDLARIEAEREDGIANHRPFDLEFRIIREPEEIRWISVKGGASYNEAGEVVRVFGVDLDVTERRRAEETVRRQLSLIQEALVPAVPQMNAGYEAASVYVPAYPGQQIGGDFYEVFRTENGHIGIVIGDVAGKGIESAALAAAARNTVRAFAYELSSPGVALSHTNSVLQAHETDFSRFVTMLLITIEPETGMLSYARAGHPPAALRRLDGSLEFLASGNTAVGILPGLKYETFQDNLDPGDMLVLYTDGIVEARREGELFEEEGVQTVLSTDASSTPKEVVDRLLDAAREWTGGRLQDDIAILAVRRVQ